MPFFDAERTDDDIYGLAHRNSLRTQQAIIARCLDGKFIVQHRSNGKLAKVSFDQCRLSLAPGTLKNLEKNQITDQNIGRSSGEYASQAKHGFRLRCA